MARSSIVSILIFLLSISLTGGLSWLILEILKGQTSASSIATIPTTIPTTIPAGPPTMIPDQIATTSPALPQVLNNGFFGPFVKSWSEFDCPTVGTVEETSTVDECQKLCLSKEKCNVINRKVDGTGKCRMLQCPTGKRPNNFDSLSQGFSLYKGEANW